MIGTTTAAPSDHVNPCSPTHRISAHSTVVSPRMVIANRSSDAPAGRMSVPRATSKSGWPGPSRTLFVGVDHRTVVEPGATDEDRRRATNGDVGQDAPVFPLELRDSEVVRRVDQVDHVMRDAAPFRRRGLGRADVHPSVDLHRVDRYELDVAQLFGDGHRHR